MTRLAAVDLGSLTVRLAVAEALGEAGFRVIRHRREITALGRGLSALGSLDPQAKEATFRALREFAREIRNLGVKRGQAAATQAVRQARDGQEFLRQAEEILRLPVRLLTPVEEARLTLKGVLSVLDPVYLSHPLLVFDVGGGSSEFILCRPGEEPVFAGLPLGVLSLSQARPLGDPPRPDRVSALQEELGGSLREFFSRHFPQLTAEEPILVGTAGAVTTLAALAQALAEYDPERVNNYILTQERLAALRELLASLPEAQRARLPGLEPQKAGVMVAGALLIEAIMDGHGADRLVTIDAGLLEGLLAELL